MSGDSGLLTALCLSRSPAHILWVGLKNLRCPWYQNKGSLHCQDLRFCILRSPGLHHLADKWLTLTCQACAKHFGALSPLVLTTALVMWMLTETLFLIHYEFISWWGKELRGKAQVVKRQSKRWQHGPMLFYSSDLGFWRQSWGMERDPIASYGFERMTLVCVGRVGGIHRMEVKEPTWIQQAGKILQRTGFLAVS